MQVWGQMYVSSCGCIKLLVSPVLTRLSLAGRGCKPPSLSRLLLLS